MRVRFWDLNYPSNSFIMAGAAGDPTQQTAVSYRYVHCLRYEECMGESSKFPNPELLKFKF